MLQGPVPIFLSCLLTVCVFASRAMLGCGPERRGPACDDLARSAKSRYLQRRGVSSFFFAEQIVDTK